MVDDRFPTTKKNQVVTWSLGHIQWDRFGLCLSLSLFLSLIRWCQIRLTNGSPPQTSECLDCFQIPKKHRLTHRELRVKYYLAFKCRAYYLLLFLYVKFPSQGRQDLMCVCVCVYWSFGSSIGLCLSVSAVCLGLSISLWL